MLRAGGSSLCRPQASEEEEERGRWWRAPSPQSNKVFLDFGGSWSHLQVAEGPQGAPALLRVAVAVRQQAEAVTTKTRGFFERKAARGSSRCCGRRRVEGAFGGGCGLCRAEPGPDTGQGTLLLTQHGTATGCDLENNQRRTGGVAWESTAVCTHC